MALNVGPVFKKNLNRAGLFFIVAGFIASVLGGGDASSAVEIGQTAASLLGGLLVLGRELLG